MAMQRLVDIEVDSDFNIHTSYHNDFFLVRTKVLVNGENATIKSVKEGNYEEPVMSFSHGGSTISTKLWLIANTISPILHKCGIYHVDTFYYEQSPLFHVVFSSESCLKKFLQEIGDVQHLMEVELLSILSEYLKTESPQLLTTIVQLDLFLVSPNRHEAGEADVHLVTAENCSTFVTHWKDSKLFNFASLHWEGTRPPRITAHPQQLKDAVPGDTLTFTIQASGTEPLNYQWEIKTGDGSGVWQLCDVERFPGANCSTLIIPSTQKSIEGSYRCVVSNTVGSQTSEPVNLNIAKPPRITLQPQELKGAVPGKHVTFTVQATGTVPLSYQWELHTEDESGEWQLCDVERFTGANDSTLTIPRVQKSDEGSYRCVVGNIVDSRISEPVHLSIAELPRITVHPQELKDTIPGKCITLTVQATGTEPLSYQWKIKTGGKSSGWQLCDVKRIPGANSSTLIIPSVQKSNEGSYCCTVTNCAGSETSECATLTVAEPPKITAHPKELKGTVSGKPVSFTVQATGTEPLCYRWQWKPVVEGVRSGEWQNLTSGGSVQGVDTATLMFTSIESCSEGLYRCVVTNVVGEEISEYTDHINGKIRELRDVLNELSTLNQWYHFGIYLGLHWSTLDAIKKDHAHTEECRTQMLIEWEKRMIPTWSAVVKALVGIGRECLASHLAAKYGVPLPKTVDNKHLEELEIAERKEKMAAGSESTEVHYHRDEFKQLGGRLSEIEQLLKTSRDSQVPLNENVNNLMSELNKLGKEVLKLAQDRENTMLELQRKQHDFQLLSEMKSKDVAHSVEKCQLLQEILTDKKKEIKRLEKELQKKEHHLQSVQQEAQAVKDKLSKLQTELKQKHEEVKTLQKEKEELTKLYNDEKEEAVNLLQITLSSRDEMEQQLITTVEELQHKSQQIAASKSYISQLTKEVETLSSSLQEKEAVVAQLESELQSHQKAASNPKLLSDILTLTAEIAELRQTLQEAEFQKQQSTLGKDAAVQEVEAKKKVEMQLHRHLDEPPKIAEHPKSLKDALLNEPVTFSIQATGTEPLKYQWQHKTIDGNGEWQSCDVESFPGANSSTLTVPSVQRSNEGSYRCTVRNLAGSGTSECATLTLAKPPRITTHPQEVKEAVPGKRVTFSIVATGTEPLSYQWQYEAGSEGLQLYDVAKSPGANSSTLTIPRVEKLNEGSYYCIVSNCAGSETSQCAALSLAEPPRITTHPKDFKLEDTVLGQQVSFTIQATGTKPLNYQWQYNPDTEGWSEEWQPCSGSNTATLTIPSVQKSNEGSYRCVVSNCAGSRTSKAAKLLMLTTATCNVADHNLQPEVEAQEKKVKVDGVQAVDISNRWQITRTASEIGYGVATAVKKGLRVLNLFKKKPDLDGDFNPDFLSICEAVDKRLRVLCSKYKLSTNIVHELDETRRQFMEKQVLIGVIGFYNTGKSTLLNSLLRARLLPTKKDAETSVQVLIQHIRTDLPLVQSTAAAVEEPTLEVTNVKGTEVVHGAELICKKLQTLNATVRRDPQNHSVAACTLLTCVPFLADVPNDWHVSLVDTPGLREYDSHVEFLATEAPKSSSAYVYITTYERLYAQTNANCLRSILAHDQGVSKGTRLIIVVTKFDQAIQSAEDFDLYEEITEEKVKKQVCQLVHKTCGVEFSNDDVLVVSGIWAYNARMLANTGPEVPTHDRYQKSVKNCLCDVPNATCGQGEDPCMSLDKVGDDVLSAKLEEASGIITLEERIKTMIKSCIAIWVDKIKGDYERYSKAVSDEMGQASSKLSESIQCDEKHQKLIMDYLKAIDDLRKELKENRQVHEEIAQKYQVDLEIGKSVALDLVATFREQCVVKVKDKKVEFGPRQLEADIKDFLEMCTKELDETFSSTCTFPSMSSVLMDHVYEMKVKVEKMKKYGRLLSPGKAATPLEKAETNEEEAQVSELLEPLEKQEPLEPLEPPKTQVLPELQDLEKPLEPQNTPELLETLDLHVLQPLEPLTLGDIKLVKPLELCLGEKVKIPGKLTFWRRLFTEQHREYRKWDDELEETIKALRQFLEEQCDIYFVDIKQHAVKYFHGQYCRETRMELAAFDAEFKEDIDNQKKEVKKLQNKIEDNNGILLELNETHCHLKNLEAHLNAKAGEYLQMW